MRSLLLYRNYTHAEQKFCDSIIWKRERERESQLTHSLVCDSAWRKNLVCWQNEKFAQYALFQKVANCIWHTYTHAHTVSQSKQLISVCGPASNLQITPNLWMWSKTHSGAFAKPKGVLKMPRTKMSTSARLCLCQSTTTVIMALDCL